jgi:hypothetical protein
LGKVGDDIMDVKRSYSVETTLTSGQVCQLLADGKVNNLPVTTGKTLGISQNSDGAVMLKGVSKCHSGLTIGAFYYYNTNGVISTDSNGTFIGIAISDTNLYMPDYIID